MLEFKNVLLPRVYLVMTPSIDNGKQYVCAGIMSASLQDAAIFDLSVDVFVLPTPQSSFVPPGAKTIST